MFGADGYDEHAQTRLGGSIIRGVQHPTPNTVLGISGVALVPRQALVVLVPRFIRPSVERWARELPKNVFKIRSKRIPQYPRHVLEQHGRRPERAHRPQSGGKLIPLVTVGQAFAPDTERLAR